MGFGIGMVLLLLVLAAIFGMKRLKIRRARKMREYFFKQNHGLLIRQLVDKDIAEKMICSLEELEKASWAVEAMAEFTKVYCRTSRLSPLRSQ